MRLETPVLLSHLPGPMEAGVRGAHGVLAQPVVVVELNHEVEPVQAQLRATAEQAVQVQLLKTRLVIHRLVATTQLSVNGAQAQL